MYQPQVDLDKIAVVYVRQSTAAQVDENVQSTKRQMELRQVAENLGFKDENIKVVADDLGVSGRTIDKRKGMMQVLNLIGQNEVACVIAEDMTRLSRDEFGVDQMKLGAMFHEAGVPVFVNGNWFDMADDQSLSSYQVQAFMSAWGWRLIRSKLKANRLRAAQDGRAVTRLGRGYRKNTVGNKRDAGYGVPVVHEDEAKVIRELIRELPAAGSVRALLEQRPRTWPDGKPVTWTHIKKIFTNPIYRGTYKWGSVVKENNHPAIIGPEDAAMIDDLNKRNRATKRKDNPKSCGLLAGLVWCPDHHRRIETNTCNHSPSYRCQVSKPGTEYSYHFGIDASKVDALVMDDLWRRLDSGLIDAILEQAETARKSMLEGQDDDRERLQRLERRIENYAARLGDDDLEPTAVMVIKGKLNQASKEADLLKKKINQSLSSKPDFDFYTKLRSDIEVQFGSLVMGWKDESIAKRRRFLSRFIERIDICQRPQLFEIVIQYLDGHTTTLTHRRREWSHNEMMALTDLLNAPERPSRGLIQWLQKQMAAKGFERSPSALYKTVSNHRSKQKALSRV